MKKVKIKNGFAPKFGQDCSDEYVNSYFQSHLKPINFLYKKDYFALILADNLLEDYHLLDIGCGTGGYYRLLKNFKTIIGLDYSTKMIKAAQELKGKLGLENISFVNESFEKFKSGEKKFDLIRVGILGDYEPHSVNSMKKIADLLVEQGIAIFKINIPVSPREWLICFFGQPANLSTSKKFINSINQIGCFRQIFSVKQERTITYFLQKNGD